jgi:microcystin-dependent protein
MQYVGFTPPTGWLFCYGQSLSRATYSALFGVIAPSLGTVTMTIASPGVVTLTAHGLQNGDPVIFTTTGALPTGITANTTYFVYNKTANTFQLTTARLNAGTVVNTSGTQSGTHTLRYVPFGVPDTSNFYVPDFRGRVAAGSDGMGGTLAGILSNQALNGVFGNMGAMGGEPTHVQTLSELAAHSHTTQSYAYVAAGGFWAAGANYNIGTSSGTNSAGSSAAMNQMQPTAVINFIIAT